ncbi:hypothetical protein F511_18083 [Dorcoceras hygrometricum]|uniref:Uncharacterized protein n=1 Tax=Dorcoceras hygrometricum TaxID=472368 RepID=A0A2Z7CSM6_9LAMI|nr:hypothetical protein F511_18083 [Dorcoceras hygrometricum]
MSLFDLQDVCIAIGSIATLDLPMVVDPIGIYGLKGPYYTLTTTKGSHKYWIRDSRTDTQLNVLSIRRGFWECDFLKGQQRSNRDLPMLRGKTTTINPKPNSLVRRPPSLLQPHAAPPPPLAAAGKLFPAKFDEENPSAQISSGLLVQADKGIPSPIVDLIDDIYRRLP